MLKVFFPNITTVSIINIVAKSCEAEKKAENSNFEKLKADLQEEHKKAVSSLKDAEEIKAEKYTYKNKLYDAQMTHESRIQEIKDRKHDATCISST